jgi:3-oxoadipate enol-lactonase
MTATSRTPSGIAYDRAGPGGALPVVLVHAGVADRRMWDPVWPALVADRDAVRLDLRGFGESSTRPPAALSPVDDVLETLAALGIGRCHLVGVSYGAGVALEVALTRPDPVASLLLVAPGGSLLAELTPDLRAFFEAEGAALDRGDLDAAVEANLRTWVDGPSRAPGAVAPEVRALVAQMQRRAFELTADWDDVEERELEPPALERLGELRVPTLVLLGALDLDAVHDAARRLADGVRGARLVEWPDTAHLPPLERPEAFLALLRSWLAEGAGPSGEDRGRPAGVG